MTPFLELLSLLRGTPPPFGRSPSKEGNKKGGMSKNGSERLPNNFLAFETCNKKENELDFSENKKVKKKDALEEKFLRNKSFKK